MGDKVILATAMPTMTVTILDKFENLLGDCHGPQFTMVTGLDGFDRHENRVSDRDGTGVRLPAVPPE